MIQVLPLAFVKALKMFSKGIAIVAITKQGTETAVRIQQVLTTLKLNSKVYAPAKYAQARVIPLDKKLGEFVKETYGKVDGIVAVMAAGIVVRAVAPLLESKLTDPAVVIVDVSGRFAVSLLSGHYGGANELTKLIADGIGATPVITTASDAMGKQSVDELARTLHLSIENPESLVAVNSAVVNGEKLVLVKMGDAKIPLTNFIGFSVEKANTVEEAAKILNRYDAGAVITQKQLSKKKFMKPVTFLKPKTIAVGLGARKIIDEEAISEAVKTALAKVNMPLERVDRLATVSIKKDSESMIKAAEKLGFKLEFLDVEALGAFKHGDLSPDSEIVKRNIGVGGVCERAALMMAGEKPRLILKKMKQNGVTVAIAEGE
jgi:cobalt-precorrin 5A hydrolase